MEQIRLRMEMQKLFSDLDKKIAIIEQCGAELREQAAIHPYHGRIWFFYGRYFMLKENWDSCIVTFKKALTIGKGATVNSIEDMSQKMLYNGLSMKLKRFDIQRDSSLNIIAQAEIPGYFNPYMNILKGLVYNRSGEYQLACIAIAIPRPKRKNRIKCQPVNSRCIIL